MSGKSIRGFLFVALLLVLTLIVLVIPTSAAPGGQGGNASGFHALSGDAAKAYRIPNDMRLEAQENMANGLTADRYRQYVGDAAVLGGQMTVYRDASGEALAVIGGHYPGISPANSVNLGQGQARQIVMAQIGAGGRWIITLSIDPASSRYYYEVESQRFDSRWFYWIDAGDGAILNAYDGLMDGSGTGVKGDTKDLTGLTTFSGGQYQMVSADGRQTTYDALNRNRLPGTLATDSDDIWNLAGSASPGQPALVDAQYFARVTDNYYLGTHSFNWLAHYPQGMVSSAHVQRNYNNAYWNGTQMAYGDGDGVSFIEFSGDLDVVGHELSHGVTDATSDLIYQNESGALNEAFSDIMGTSIEFYYGTGNWTIGEDITPGDNGIRNMADPGEDGDPSHYDERYTGTGDNGGVHINSGIANHWFYLLANGGQNADPAFASGTAVQGIGLAAAGQIAFMGFTALPANASFCAAREGTMTIAVASGNAANVADAWDEVGVDVALCGGGGGGGGNGPVITNVASTVLNAKRGSFKITWNTDIPADSEVTFTCCGSYSNSTLVTSHSMSFNGSKGYLYEYYVSSTANGIKTAVGPFYHQN